MDLQLKSCDKDNDKSKSIDWKTNVDEDHEKLKPGISMFKTFLFLAGENAGAGLLALPHTLNKAGWLGVPLLVMILVDAAVAASLIGKCWIILEERWPKYRSNCRNPYPEIGKVTHGPRMRSLVTLCLQTNLIGSSAVLLLVCAQLTSDLIDHSHNLPFGLWILIVGLTICPFMWLGTPAEFWPAAAIALGTSAIAVILLIFEISKDLVSIQQTDQQLPEKSQISLSTFSLAFGSFMFACGGTGPFPTYQNDMKDKSKWNQSVTMGFICLFILFAPLAIIGYIVYGSNVTTNIILSIPLGINRILVTILMAGHLFFAFLLMINPAVQQIENRLNVPHHFNWKRVAIRVSVLCLIIFICETIPRFGKILDFMGGSSMTCLAYIFPPLFYIKLCSMKNPCWPERRISMISRLYFYKIILFGLVGGVCATVSAAVAILSPDTFVLPCYIDFDCTNG